MQQEHEVGQELRRQERFQEAQATQRQREREAEATRQKRDEWDAWWSLPTLEHAEDAPRREPNALLPKA